MTSYRVALPPTLLAEVEDFLANRGTHGIEGTGLVACTRSEGDSWIAQSFIAPEQRAHRSGSGCWVEVTDAGKRQLAAALRSGERYLVRVHSHPGEAFHSATDDRNPALTFIGALSVVVPYFGLGLRRGLDACAVLRLTAAGWQPIDDRREWLRAGTAWESAC